MHRLIRGLIVPLAFMAVACSPTWLTTNYPSNEALYRASLTEFKQGHWENALTGFDKLTADLPVRDSLLPRSYWYSGRSHEEREEFLLAAQSFSRLVESFPDDSLGPRAALEAARSYAKLWTKPDLDATYGETALGAFTTVLGLYPGSAAADSAQRGINTLNEWFATKAYKTGMFYFRSDAWDQAIIYFKYVLANWPQTATARDALLRMAESYKALKFYKDDVAETCAQLRKAYTGDREVELVCHGVGAAAAPVPPPGPPAQPPPR